MLTFDAAAERPILRLDFGLGVKGAHHMQTADAVTAFSTLLIFINLILKATGYSDTDWNWELLFLVVDSVAVACLFYGIRRERAALLQPFVVLSIVTINFLVLLTMFFASAVWDPHSYAGEYLEMELRENVQSFAQSLSVQQKSVIPIVAAVLTVPTAATVFINCWFLQIIVACARLFREQDKKKKDAECQNDSGPRNCSECGGNAASNDCHFQRNISDSSV